MRVATATMATTIPAIAPELIPRLLALSMTTPNGDVEGADSIVGVGQPGGGMGESRSSSVRSMFHNVNC